MNVLMISGSLRAASSSTAVVRHLQKFIGDKAQTSVADIGVLPHYNADLGEVAEVEAFKAEIAGSDGVIFVTPEYNYSIPGVLKNAIDWASRPGFNGVFKGKPVMVISVSGGILGGARAQGDLKYALNGLLANLFLSPEVVVPQAPAKMVDGEFTWPEGEKFIHDKVTAFLDGIPDA